MGFDEGRIILDRADGAYYAGETVCGSLEFRQDKVKTCRGIYVKVKGYAHTHWTTSRTRRGADGKSHSYTVNHDGHEDYFSCKQYLVGGASGECHLQPGQHTFQFRCPLPAHCPTSFEGQHGHVRYELKVAVDRAFQLDQEKQIRLHVTAPLDLNASPTVREPLELEMEATYCSWCVSAGGVETRVTLPAAGACPGQLVRAQLACRNASAVAVTKVKLAIKRDTRFYAHSEPGVRSGSRETIAEVKKGPVPSNTSRTWEVHLQLPDDVCPASLQACRIIDLSYVFKVQVVPSGCHSNTEEEREFVIGTVPLVAGGGVAPAHVASPYPTPGPYPAAAGPFPSPGPYPTSSPYPAAPGPYPTPGPYPAGPYPAASSGPHPCPPPPAYYPGPAAAAMPASPSYYPEKRSEDGDTAAGAPPPYGPKLPAAAFPPLPYPAAAAVPPPPSAVYPGVWGAGPPAHAPSAPAAAPYTPRAHDSDDNASYAFNPSVVPPEKQIK